MWFNSLQQSSSLYCGARHWLQPISLFSYAESNLLLVFFSGLQENLSKVRLIHSIWKALSFQTDGIMLVISASILSRIIIKEITCVNVNIRQYGFCLEDPAFFR